MIAGVKLELIYYNGMYLFVEKDMRDLFLMFLRVTVKLITS